MGARFTRSLKTDMKNIELTIIAEHADTKALYKFVESLQRLQDLPSAIVDVNRRSPSAIELKISYPLTVFDHSVGQFMSVLFGEIPFMRAFGQAQFEDLQLPDEVYEWLPGRPLEQSLCSRDSARPNHRYWSPS